MKTILLILAASAALLAGVASTRAADSLLAPAPVKASSPDARILAIQNANDPSAAIAALTQAAAERPDDPSVLEAYVRRMVDFGLPQMAYRQAEALLDAKPASGLAWALVAHKEAAAGNSIGAFSALTAALARSPREPFAVKMAGELMAWFDQKADKGELARSVGEMANRLRATLKGNATFEQAYAQASSGYDQAAPSEKEAVAAAPPEPAAYVPFTSSYVDIGYGSSYWPGYPSYWGWPWGGYRGLGFPFIPQTVLFADADDFAFGQRRNYGFGSFSGGDGSGLVLTPFSDNSPLVIHGGQEDGALVTRIDRPDVAFANGRRFGERGGVLAANGLVSDSSTLPAGSVGGVAVNSAGWPLGPGNMLGGAPERPDAVRPIAPERLSPVRPIAPERPTPIRPMQPDRPLPELMPAPHRESLLSPPSRLDDRGSFTARVQHGQSFSSRQGLIAPSAREARAILPPSGVQGEARFGRRGEPLRPLVPPELPRALALNQTSPVLPAPPPPLSQVRPPPRLPPQELPNRYVAPPMPRAAPGGTMPPRGGALVMNRGVTTAPRAGVQAMNRGATMAPRAGVQAMNRGSMGRGSGGGRR